LYASCRKQKHHHDIIIRFKVFGLGYLNRYSLSLAGADIRQRGPCSHLGCILVLSTLLAALGGLANRVAVDIDATAADLVLRGRSYNRKVNIGAG
jgi:hypothetical protein